MRTKRTASNAFGGILLMACLGLIGMAKGQPQQGPSGYHLVKTVKLGGTRGWDYLVIDPENRKLFVSQDTHVIVVNPDTGDVVGDIVPAPWR